MQLSIFVSIQNLMNKSFGENNCHETENEWRRKKNSTNPPIIKWIAIKNRLCLCLRFRFFFLKRLNDSVMTIISFDCWFFVIAFWWNDLMQTIHKLYIYYMTWPDRTWHDLIDWFGGNSQWWWWWYIITIYLLLCEMNIK